MPRMAKQKVVKERNQRCAFASGGHVCRAEVGDHRDLQPRRQHRSLAGLPRSGDCPPQIRPRVALVINRLTMTADQIASKSALPRGNLHGVGVDFSQPEVEACQVGDAGACRVHGGEHGASYPRGVWVFTVGQQLQTRAQSASLQADERDIDSVRRGAAHDARNNHWPTPIFRMSYRELFPSTRQRLWLRLPGAAFRRAPKVRNAACQSPRPSALESPAGSVRGWIA